MEGGGALPGPERTQFSNFSNLCRQKLMLVALEVKNVNFRGSSGAEQTHSKLRDLLHGVWRRQVTSPSIMLIREFVEFE